MEGWMWLPVTIGVIWFIGWIQSLIEERQRKKREEAKEQVYQDLPNKEGIMQLLDTYKRKVQKVEKEATTFGDSDEELQSVIDTKVHSIKFSACPKCSSGRLILRTGRYGEFFGCNKYPSCSYIKNIKKVTSELKKRFHGKAKEAFTNDFLKLLNKY